MGVGTYCHPGRIHSRPINTPGRVIIRRADDITVFERVPLEVIQIKHPELSGHIHGHYELLAIARDQFEIIDLLLIIIK